jgi:hypothetical protein
MKKENGENNKTLFLVLKKQWFEMIESGEKKEEYRSQCQYWSRRIWQKRKELTRVVFQFGYKKDAARMEFEIAGFALLYSRSCPAVGDFTPELKPEWGYEAGDSYYVLRLGKRIK